MQPGILTEERNITPSLVRRILPSSPMSHLRGRVREQRGVAMKYSPVTIRLLVSLGLLPLLTCACLTTKSANAPAARGLTGSEAWQLETMTHRDIQSKSRLSEKDDSPENLAEMAAMFLQHGDYEKSLYNYSKILSQTPERHEVRYKMGVALLLCGNPEEAKKELATVLLHRMDMLEAHEALGLIYLQENNLTEAQQEFRFVLAQDPKRFQSCYLLGETYLRSNQYSQALKEFQTAQEIEPRNARVMSALGWTYVKLKKYDQGLVWLRKAKTSNPEDRTINNRLGMVLAGQKKFPEALEAFRRAGDEAQAFNNIGVYYYLEHRHAEAARCFQKALELRPTFYQEAKVNLDKALAKLQAENPAPADTAGRQPDRLSLSRRPPTNLKDLSD
jgi:Tfp pilus assembly protein PilF